MLESYVERSLMKVVSASMFYTIYNPKKQWTSFLFFLLSRNRTVFANVVYQ